MNEAYIAELEAELRYWTDWRNGIVNAARTRIKEDQKSIREANKAFDEKALWIQHQLDQLRPVSAPAQSTRKSSQTQTVESLVTQGWDPADAAHYLELLSK